jgi:hypothetical protein
MSIAMSRRSLLLVLAVLAAIALPVAPALAGDGPLPISPSHSGGDLPFSDIDLALLAAAGAMLGAAGYGMRHLTRAPDSAQPRAEGMEWNR